MLTMKTDKQDPEGILFKVFIPPVAVGAGKVFFDIWNGSTKTIEVGSVVPVVSGAVAVVGTLAVDLYLTRTTAIGTGGTAATRDSATLTEMIFTRMDTEGPLIPAAITGRLAPAGGATAGAVIGFNSMFTEETNLASYFRNNMLEVGQPGINGRFKIRPGTGIRVVQGSVASVGNIGFDIVAQVLP